MVYAGDPSFHCIEQYTGRIANDTCIGGQIYCVSNVCLKCKHFSLPHLFYFDMFSTGLVSKPLEVKRLDKVIL